MSGLFLLRLAERQFVGLLFQLPPRNTRLLFNAVPARLRRAIKRYRLRHATTSSVLLQKKQTRPSLRSGKKCKGLKSKRAKGNKY
jgi:hypothetical protein